jgi:hypothetical protein
MPDVETYTAILPSLANRRVGLMHAKYKDHFATASDDTLVIQASTRQLNQTLDQR